uniref:Transcriptional modulator of MazE/toxin, MazF n=1 Tax=Acetithermum autotrophicum TaxID=1446466 RepID=H5SUM7_ACEAU|nr:transcriptional modulator of MazE/toxin, MazF [Candidatus Acetothermum autotrophicum]
MVQKRQTRTKEIHPGDVVVVSFPGVKGLKRRPAVVVSTDGYHSARPDVIIGLLTSQIGSATTPTDYVLRDWTTAGLQHPSAFRAFLVTLPKTSVKVVGHLSDFDWKEIQTCLRRAIAVS